jgi:phage gp37-like protein
MGATEFKLDDVEKGIIATLAADSGVLALSAQVQGLSSRHFDEQGNIIVMPPAILVSFNSGSDDCTQDTVRTTYQVDYEFFLLCGAADLSSVDKERSSAYVVIATARHAIAGKRFQLDSGAVLSGPAALAGIEPYQFDANGVWYLQKIRVPKTAQF